MQVGPFFNDMEKFISDSRAHIAAGQDVDMAGLDSNIEKLCNMILALSDEEQRLYEDRMRDMLVSLNELGIELKAQMEGDVRDIPMHRAASVAYKTADSRDNFGIRKEDEE